LELIVSVPVWLKTPAPSLAIAPEMMPCALTVALSQAAGHGAGRRQGAAVDGGRR
jgi:hypothetical protein